jgi:hypothetical protein
MVIKMVTALTFFLSVLIRLNNDTDQTGKRKACFRPLQQGKTIRAIAIEARMSFRDIGTILKKASKEKEERRKKKEERGKRKTSKSTI